MPFDTTIFEGLFVPTNSTFTNDMKRGLILEGGAMRGLFTCGVIDVMMEHGIWPDGLIGVSAGAAFGCNYKSRQPGRGIRYNKRFAKDGRFSGLGSLLRSGDYFNAEFAYHTVPDMLDKFDVEAFEQNPMEFVVVCTDAVTGKPVYKRLEKGGPLTNDWIRASASMPLASKVVELEGYKLLDGGVADSIPLAYFEQLGYDRNIVVLTQPMDYRKEHNRLMPLMRIGLHRYPEMIKALDRRHLMYNKEVEYVRQTEKEGRCLVIRPEGKIPIGHVSHDAQLMEQVYQMGRQTGAAHLDAIRRYWE
jgi:predicted patatin/cPLA2 family phospholipase